VNNSVAFTDAIPNPVSLRTGTTLGDRPNALTVSSTRHDETRR